MTPTVLTNLFANSRNFCSQNSSDNLLTDVGNFLASVHPKPQTKQFITRGVVCLKLTFFFKVTELIFSLFIFKIKLKKSSMWPCSCCRLQRKILWCSLQKVQKELKRFLWRKRENKHFKKGNLLNIVLKVRVLSCIDNWSNPKTNIRFNLNQLCKMSQFAYGFW